MEIELYSTADSIKISVKFFITQFLLKSYVESTQYYGKHSRRFKQYVDTIFI